MKKKLLLLLLLSLVFTGLARAAGEDAGGAVQGYAWRIVNFVIGVSAIVIAGNLAWCMTDMEMHGKRAKGLLLGLIGLGCIWGLVRFVAGTAEDSGTSVKGLSTAADMKP